MPALSRRTDEPQFGPTRWVAVSIAGLLGVVLIARVAAVYTENIQWDEFALLQRAVLTLQTGRLHTGGRPGLGTLVLVPFAAGCSNAVDAIVQARLLWTGMVLVSAAAFVLLLRSILLPSAHRRAALAAGLALWVLAPPFLRYSVQVRNDQPAIMFGLLGGLALVASRQRTAWAAVAGLLFGIGFLFTQKLVYVAGLVGVLGVGQLLLLGDWRPRRDTLRAGLAAAAFLLVVVGYRALMQQLSGTAPAVVRLGASFDVFAYYREAHGWRLYEAMLPSLVPQFLVAIALLATTADWLRDRGRHGRELAVAWLVVLTGVVVVLFHAARFPYFYMVLGLFPATAGALALGPMLERVGGLPARRAVAGVLWTSMALFGVMRALAITRDTQRNQQESLAFVERNFPEAARGFHTHGAFACRRDPAPFPVRFNQNVVAEFGGDDGVERGRQMIAEFRQRPVSFMIHPQNPRYPEELQLFWATRYVHYYGAVHVPGRILSGPPGYTTTFEAVVPGEYVWRPSAAGSTLQLGGTVLAGGNSVRVERTGLFPASLPEGGEGIIVLRLADPPAPDRRSFYLGW